MTVMELIKALRIDDHHKKINGQSEVKLASIDKEFDILSVYPDGPKGKVLWIDIEEVVE